MRTKLLIDHKNFVARFALLKSVILQALKRQGSGKSAGGFVNDVAQTD